jgi:phage-related protein
MAITSAISDFVKSIYELFESFFTTLFSLVTTIISSVVTLFSDLINLVAGTLKGGANVLGETGKFLFGTLHPTTPSTHVYAGGRWRCSANGGK